MFIEYERYSYGQMRKAHEIQKIIIQWHLKIRSSQMEWIFIIPKKEKKTASNFDVLESI